ncbi:MULTISPECIES: hypothetical protein [unclassified Psychrobacillus]|uniref:hypothetical protein n=1 Tax=unclassified Psychrobacillus TaxID=2636677 RepID=UPI0030F8B49D
MKNMMSKLREKAGFISVETVIVAALLIGLGVFAIGQFVTVGTDASNAAVDAVTDALLITPGI